LEHWMPPAALKKKGKLVEPCWRGYPLVPKKPSSGPSGLD